MLQQIWLYRPRAGSQVIVDASRHPILTVDLGIGTIIAGDCVEISFEASAPGNWWRDTATRLAEQIALGVGGVAFDAQGTIGLVVPAADGLAVRIWLIRLGRLTSEDVALIDAQLWKQWLMSLGTDEYGAMELAPLQHLPLPEGQEVTAGLARVYIQPSPPLEESDHGVRTITPPGPVPGFALRVGVQTVGDEQWVSHIDIHCRGRIEDYHIRAVEWGDICDPSWVAGEESARIITHPAEGECKVVESDVVALGYAPCLAPSMGR